VKIYHITSRAAWTLAAAAGAYTTPSLRAEGFIHCSSARQVLPVAQEFYPGQSGLVLLVIDPNKVESSLKWERSGPPAGMDPSAAFPHVYGPIPLEAVIEILDFDADEHGRFILPPMLADDETAQNA